MALGIVCEAVEPRLVAAACVVCDAEFHAVKPSRGRVRITCSEACQSERSRRYTRKPYVRALRERACKRCGGLFQSAQTKAFYCGTECLRAGLSASAKERAAERAPIIAEARRHECQRCGREFHRRSYGKQGENKFCSRDCGYAANRRPMAPALTKPPKPLPQPKPLKSYCCKICGAVYQFSGMGRPIKTCGDQCTLMLKRQHRAVARVLRRAREHAATIEPVNPYKVFTRDGWKCRVCRRKTPRSKRGTYEPDAPELDHIVPLSRGGEHSYRNTQCLCRACNAAKGDREIGQLLLFG